MNCESLSYPSIVIWAGADPVAGATSYKILSNRTATPVRCMGEDIPIGFVHSYSEHIIELSLIDISRCLSDPMIDFASLANFTLTLQNSSKKVIFEHCNWKALEQRSEDGSIIEKAVLVSTLRREERVVQPEET